MYLSAGQKYVIVVRAETSAGRFLVSASNGFTVDTSPPDVSIVSVGRHPVNGSDYGTLYQAEGDSFTASWTVTDSISDIMDVWYYVGTYPGVYHS